MAWYSIPIDSVGLSSHGESLLTRLENLEKAHVSLQESHSSLQELALHVVGQLAKEVSPRLQNLESRFGYHIDPSNKIAPPTGVCGDCAWFKDHSAPTPNGTDLSCCSYVPSKPLRSKEDRCNIQHFTPQPKDEG
jgi:hypothetical protein